MATLLGKTYRIVDDDGIVVLVSEKGAQRRYADRAFGYKYPDELLEAMSVGDAFAWRTGGEGEHSIDVAFGPGGSASKDSSMWTMATASF